MCREQDPCNGPQAHANVNVSSSISDGSTALTTNINFPISNTTCIHGTTSVSIFGSSCQRRTGLSSDDWTTRTPQNIQMATGQIALRAALNSEFDLDLAESVIYDEQSHYCLGGDLMLQTLDRYSDVPLLSTVEILNAHGIILSRVFETEDYERGTGLASLSTSAYVEFTVS
ncbi:unnamed protein product [Protopolystoma xenopodis]|uniref:Uncharacterized protein n=1 Tax=Protopolystoma xenopodis TaxID=117903 RepID=A0A3S5AXG6_9PLAT|nr:unnamed protein product [Protopolystoma xenopodis]